MKINANEIPGPGSYNTELSRNAESNGKGFGSTATRFRERVADNLPAPGAYEAAQAEFNLHLKKPFRGAQHKAFGSLSRRFRNLKGNSDPGPQTYNVQDDKSLNSLGFSTYNYMHHFNSSKHQDKEKVSKKILKRVRVVKIGNLVVDPVSAHVPVFGSQGDRFQAREVGYGPPPGIYDVNTAFKKLKNRGHVDPTFLSTLKSKFFESLEGPGPGFYDPIVASTSKRVADEGMFMSKEDRFQKQVESIVPAPNHYSMKERGLLKKTFNVSFK